MSNTNLDPNAFTAEDQADIAAMKADADGYVNIHEFCHDWFHQQAQYLSRELDKPEVAEGMRIHTDRTSYHSYSVHQDDLQEVFARIRKSYWALGRRTR